MHMINKFTTLNKNVHRGATYYINYHNLGLWLEDWFPGYSFTFNTDITDNTVTVNISKVSPDDDIGNKEIYVACAKIPFVFIMDNDDYRIIQAIQDAIYRKECKDKT